MQLLFLEEAVMPQYRHSGTFNFAPDRGSPDGNKEPFSNEFAAACDVTAKAHVAEWKKYRVDIVDEKLVRIDVAEKTTPIELQ